jgi:hypothetical protein
MSTPKTLYVTSREEWRVILAEILARCNHEIGSVVMPPTAPGNHEMGPGGYNASDKARWCRGGGA